MYKFEEDCKMKVTWNRTKRIRKSLCTMVVATMLCVSSIWVYADEVSSDVTTLSDIVSDVAVNEVGDVNNLPDGQYDLYAEMIKMDRENYSMANNGINHTVRLEVVNGEYFLTIQFKGLAIYNKFGYLMNLSYYGEGYTYNQIGVPKGDLVPAEVISTYDVVDRYNDAEHLYPELLKIKLVDKASEQYVPLQVFVPIMESITTGSGTQNVLMEIDWSTLKKTDEEIEVEEQEEQSPELIVTDEATSVKIYAEKGVFEEGAIWKVEPITEGETFTLVSEVLSDVSDKFVAYAVKVVDTEDTLLQPNGTVTLSFPVTEDLKDQEMVLYRINDDGTKTITKGNVENGYYTAVTKRFGMYALAIKYDVMEDENNSEADDSYNDNADVDDVQNADTVKNGHMQDDVEKFTETKSTETESEKGKSKEPDTGDYVQIEILWIVMTGAAGIMVLTGRKCKLNQGD